MFENLLKSYWSMTPESQYAWISDLVCISGTICMFLMPYTWKPTFPNVNNIFGILPKLAWSRKNKMFCLGYFCAIIMGEHAMGKFANLLLLSDCGLGYMYYSTNMSASKRYHMNDVLKQVVRNTFFHMLFCVRNYQHPAYAPQTLREYAICITGVILFFLGMWTKMTLDMKTAKFNQRYEGVINKGGIYEYVVAPEQFASAIQWLGFAMASGTEISYAFFYYKLQTAFGKSVLIYQQNLVIDPNYLSGRKMLFPFILTRN